MTDETKQPRKHMMGKLLRTWRLVTETDMRTAAVKIGIGASTLCRIEAGREPDLRTWLKIQEWLWK
jgi:hypothetical protein